MESACRQLDARLTGRRVTRAELASFSALKTVDPPLAALVGEEVTAVDRRGKKCCVRTTGPVLVVDFARAGWVRWREELPAEPARPGRGPLALRLGVEGGAGIEVSEQGTEKRLALHVARRLEEVEAVAALGIDPLDPALTAERLGALLAGERGDLKHALSRQSLLAGVGNAWSDEVLHAARLSPFQPAARLGTAGVERLHAALVTVLRRAIDELAEVDLASLKAHKRAQMAVHGRTGLPCPDCGEPVREVAYASRSLQYCAHCQTGGRVLADRRLSRLLK